MMGPPVKATLLRVVRILLSPLNVKSVNLLELIKSTIVTANAIFHILQEHYIIQNNESF
jgi:hypothetical protein